MNDQAQHVERVARLRSSIALLSELTPDELAVAVPNCPGWTVRSVVSHLTYQAGIGWYTMMRGSAPAIDAPPGRGVELFDDVMTTMVDEIAAHRPSDPCNTYLGPGGYDFWAWHGANEIGLHHIHVEHALGRALSLSEADAIDGLGWTIDLVHPLMLRFIDDAAPDGSVEVVGNGSTRWTLGSGPTVATLRGPLPDLFPALWGRASHPARIEGDEAVARWWFSLPSRSFQHPALG